MRQLARAARAARIAPRQGRDGGRDRRRERSHRVARKCRRHDPRRDEIRARRETLPVHQLRHGAARARGRGRQADGPRGGGCAGAARARGLTMRFLLLLLAVLAAYSTAGVAQEARPKNVIILFADGVAATQWELGRYSARVLRNQGFAATDIVFKDGAFGVLSTNPRDAFVTDSAAAASAMSTGVKVDNFAVSMTPDRKSTRL